MKKVLSILVVAIIFVMGCKKDEEVDPAIQLAEDVTKIEAYLADHNINATKTESSLYYVIDNEGTGTEYPNSTATVTIKYRAYLLNGTVFDETLGNTTRSFNMAGLIEGMQEGIQLMKVGAKGKLFIPSVLGYGTSGTANIPSNACLIFEVEIISFTNG